MIWEAGELDYCSSSSSVCFWRSYFLLLCLSFLICKNPGVAYISTFRKEGSRENKSHEILYIQWFRGAICMQWCTLENNNATCPGKAPKTLQWNRFSLFNVVLPVHAFPSTCLYHLSNEYCWAHTGKQRSRESLWFLNPRILCASLISRRVIHRSVTVTWVKKTGTAWTSGLASLISVLCSLPSTLSMLSEWLSQPSHPSFWAAFPMPQVWMGTHFICLLLF